MIVRHLLEWAAVQLGLGRALEPRLRRRLERPSIRFARLERLWVYEKLQDVAERRGDWAHVERLVQEQAEDLALVHWRASAYVSAAERAFNARRFASADEYLRRAAGAPVKSEVDREFLERRAVELRARLDARAAANI
ncbi:MAG TPA: hypothetical protein VGF28_14825 [Thermoanaerobaculia bacterium]|jgi:uncharacterized protein HemY